jgi:hypothetical protein
VLGDRKGQQPMDADAGRQQRQDGQGPEDPDLRGPRGGLLAATAFTAIPLEGL